MPPYWRALLSWMPEQVDYLHDAAYWRALLSWMPEQVNYLARCRLLAGAAVVDAGAGGLSAAYWRALLGRCQGSGGASGPGDGEP